MEWPIPLDAETEDAVIRVKSRTDHEESNYAVSDVFSIERPRYTVAFESNGGSNEDPVTVIHGHAAAAPAEPVRHGYLFDGWHTDMDLTAPYDFSTPVTGHLTLYAKWRLPEQVAKPQATPSGGTVQPGTQVALSTTTVSAVL